MLISLWGSGPERSPADGQTTPDERPVRRGATALEYLVCISTILVVVIITVQHLGSVAQGLFSNSAKATTTGS